MVIHRSAVAMLALMGACGVSAAVADSPPSPAATPAAAEATSAAAPAASQPATAPATQNATATASAKSAENAAKATDGAQEKALLDAGYRPEMQHGQKVWCRREEVLGSRIEGKRVCGTADQIDVVGRQTRQDVSDSQKKLNTYPTR